MLNEEIELKIFEKFIIFLIYVIDLFFKFKSNSLIATLLNVLPNIITILTFFLGIHFTREQLRIQFKNQIDLMRQEKIDLFLLEIYNEIIDLLTKYRKDLLSCSTILFNVESEIKIYFKYLDLESVDVNDINVIHDSLISLHREISNSSSSLITVLIRYSPYIFDKNNQGFNSILLEKFQVMGELFFESMKIVIKFSEVEISEREKGVSKSDVQYSEKISKNFKELEQVRKKLKISYDEISSLLNLLQEILQCSIFPYHSKLLNKLAP
jgi:hypothetical protein